MTRTGRYQRCISALHCLEASGALTLGAMFVTAVIATPTAEAQTYTVLHRFKGSDGHAPSASLIGDSAGNLYGTTYAGGTSNYGVVFKLNKTGETVLYSFTGGADGAYPMAGLIRDSAGNLYGTTTSGGVVCSIPGGCGVVFKLDMTGTETVLYSFTGGADGAYPAAGLIRDSAGNLYGTTVDGGSLSGCNGDGCGVVYKLDTTGAETVLYSFTGGTDGANSFAGLIRDAAGNLYGTARSGGGECNLSGGCGVVFKLDTTGHETVLHRFTGGADGANPDAGLIRDGVGDLYGTSYDGALDNGVVFKLDKTGETVLYSFTGRADGGYPYAGLIRDPSGNLYGTTEVGGASGNGVVFKLDTTGHEMVLYTFTGGKDGELPQGGLIRDEAGNLYGTTTFAGSAEGLSGNGVVFKLQP